MDKKKLLAMGTAIVALSGVAAQDAHAATKNIDINAVVLQAIALQQVKSLNFGSFTVGTAAGGTVTIDTAGARTQTGTVNLVTGNAAEQAAKLKITAANGINMDVKVTTVPAVITNGNAQTMKVTAFDVNGSPTANQAVLAVTAGTNRTIPIGGTLAVANAQDPGTYTGTFTVDVQYQ